MTYRELLIQLSQLTDEQLDSDLTIQDPDIEDEFLVGLQLVTEWDEDNHPASGILDPNHPFFQMEGSFSKCNKDEFFASEKIKESVRQVREKISWPGGAPRDLLDAVLICRSLERKWSDDPS